ncbi:MAG: multidrug efflux SMR transporter [Clostridia bacterium]|nr:multidrug efflux SMR transporter [Clostridia bacterium]
MQYLLLGIAIVAELIGTTFLKYSDGYTKLAPTIGSILSYGICFYVFSKSLLNINLSVAYATWSAVGLVVTALLSVFLFKEGITPAGVVALAMITVGVVVLNLYGTPVS